MPKFNIQKCNSDKKITTNSLTELNPYFEYLESRYKNSNTIVCLKNSDFKNGTYRILNPGYYKLYEDIIFNPNPSTYSNDTLEGPDWMPDYTNPEQVEKYPIHPYHLGFFTALTVECDNVIVDLNGFSIQQSREHYLQQRFFSCIELANQPFIPNQGPSDFGLAFKSPTGVCIKNGLLGRSSHHGIHGNSMKNVLIQNMNINSFEIGGISLHGGFNVVIENTNISTNNRHVPVNAKYSQSRFIRTKLQQLLEDPQFVDGDIKIGRKYVNADTLLQNIESELVSVYRDYIINQEDTISSTFFRNDERVADGAIYGIVIAQKGVVVNEFQESRKDEEDNNNHIHLRNVYIEHLQSNPREVIGLSTLKNDNGMTYGLNVQKGPFGDVLDILSVTQNILNPDMFQVKDNIILYYSDQGEIIYDDPYTGQSLVIDPTSVDQNTIKLLSDEIDNFISSYNILHETKLDRGISTIRTITYSDTNNNLVTVKVIDIYYNVNLSPVNPDDSVINDVKDIMTSSIHKVVNSGKYIYVGDILSDSQLYISAVEESSISPDIIQWSNTTNSVYDLISANPNVDSKYNLVNRGDSMAHFMKGNIGLFISGCKNFKGDQVKLCDISNIGNEAYCSEFLYKCHGCYYDGNVTRGISVVCSENVTFKDSSIKTLYSRTGKSVGIEVHSNSTNVNVKDVHVRNVLSSDKCFEFPNRKNISSYVQLNHE